MPQNIDASIQILYLLIIGYVTRGKLSNFPEVEFPYLKMVIIVMVEYYNCASLAHNKYLLNPAFINIYN